MSTPTIEQIHRHYSVRAYKPDPVPRELIGQLCERIASLHPENLLDDDTTLFLLRPTDTSPTMKDNLLAPLRLLGPVRDRTTLS